MPPKPRISAKQVSKAVSSIKKAARNRTTNIDASTGTSNRNTKPSAEKRGGLKPRSKTQISKPPSLPSHSTSTDPATAHKTLTADSTSPSRSTSKPLDATSTSTNPSSSTLSPPSPQAPQQNQTPLPFRFRARAYILAFGFAGCAVFGSIYGAGLKAQQDLKNERAEWKAQAPEARIRQLQSRRKRCEQAANELRKKLDVVEGRIAESERERITEGVDVEKDG